MSNLDNYIQTEVNGAVGYVIMDRPEKRNALNAEMVTQLQAAFRTMEANPEVKVVVLKGTGTAFSAGADLAYLESLQSNTFDENHADSRHLMRLFEMMYGFPKVTIAEIQGHAIAGGCGLATVCDFAIAVPEAKFGYTEVRIGFIPAIVMILLIRKLGDAKARSLLLRGHLISAEEALGLGLISDISNNQDLSQAVLELGQEIASKTSGDSIRLTKQMMAEVQHMPWQDALAYAAEMNAEARATADCKKGIAAFLEGRKIEW